MNTIYSIFLTAALSLSISGCSVINVLKLRSANDDITPAWQSQDSQFPIKTDYIGEKTFIYGSINGVKGFKFMIDTGASFTVLFDTPKIQSLDLPKGYELKIGGWGDEDASLSHQTTMQTLRFGNLSVSDFQGAYIQASKTPYFARSEELIYDGVIGHDLLRHFVWTFDKSANQVTVSNKAFTASKGSYAIPFDVFMSKPSVEAEVDFGNGHIAKSDIIIDTGSRHYLKLSAQYPIGNDILLPEAKITSADFGLSGKAEHKRVTLPALRLGNLTLKNVKTNLIENVDEDDFWVIGNGIFNQFVTTIDYHQETM